MMNPRLAELQPYPFARLRAIMQGIEPPKHLKPIALHIGEPQHPTPPIIHQALTSHLDKLAHYPQTLGLPELRRACADWLHRRYDGLTLDPNTEILPTLGSREALFSFIQSAIDTTAEQPIIVSPNPFYQIYEGGALLAGAKIHLANCWAPSFTPQWRDIPESIWKQTQIVFICSPNNPNGSTMKLSDWDELFHLQDQYSFIIASDECYSEIYFDTPPIGCLQAAAILQRSNRGLIMFTSLSKRSNAPGLRSGFVAGDAHLIAAFLQYRTYHGSAMSIPTQYASIAAWSDEHHVEENRQQYRHKFEAVIPILQTHFEVTQPDASFYIWLKVPDGDDVTFAQKLWQQAAIQVLPGRFLSRDTPQGNPGQGYVRIALVAPIDDCIEAANRIIELFMQ